MDIWEQVIPKLYTPCDGVVVPPKIKKLTSMHFTHIKNTRLY